VENTNWPEDSVRVVWEVLPGDSEKIFREINLEDIDPSLFSSGDQANSDSFPTIPYPLLNPADLDRLWTQTIIKINYQFGARSSDDET
jgi:hypothetical protein